MVGGWHRKEIGVNIRKSGKYRRGEPLGMEMLITSHKLDGVGPVDNRPSTE